MLLPPDVTSTLARAGIDATGDDDRALQDAILGAIADRRGYVTWDIDDLGWRVDLHFPDRQNFHARTLELALAWALVWLMYDEIGVGGFMA